MLEELFLCRCVDRSDANQFLVHELLDSHAGELAPWTSGLEECQQVGIELLLVSLGQAMGCACIDLKSRVFDEFGRGKSRGADRYDLVVVAVNDQRWDVEFLEVFGEVRLRERLDAVKRVPMAACIPWAQNQSIIPWETFAPGRLKPKNGPLARSL